VLDVAFAATVLTALPRLRPGAATAWDRSAFAATVLTALPRLRPDAAAASDRRGFAASVVTMSVRTEVRAQYQVLSRLTRSNCAIQFGVL
jgi:hypothetical protein